MAEAHKVKEPSLRQSTPPMQSINSSRHICLTHWELDLRLRMAATAWRSFPQEFWNVGWRICGGNPEDHIKHCQISGMKTIGTLKMGSFGRLSLNTKWWNPPSTIVDLCISYSPIRDDACGEHTGGKKEIKNTWKRLFGAHQASWFLGLPVFINKYFRD